MPVDLHVHTPASSDYKGEGGDEGYIQLLTRFRDAGVKVVAITDHNTLAGYREIARLTADLEMRISVVAELADDHEDMAKALAHLTDRLDVLKSVLVLPGMEVDAKPGIHVLAIFDPSQSLDQAEQLLSDAGFPPERQGKEDRDSSAAMSVDDLLDAIKTSGGLAVLAHVDRDKGAYRSLGGTFRAKVFKSDGLSAISYCDPVTESSLSDLLAQKEYRRSRPLPMFRCSDYHGEGAVGAKLTYMQLDEINFESFRAVIEDPVGRVSQTADPGARLMIEQIAKIKSTRCFPTLDSFGDCKAAEAACALLNQWGSGQLMLGVGKNDGSISVTGVKATQEAIRALVRASLEGIDPTPSHRVAFFGYGDGLIAWATISAIGSGRLHLLADSRQAWLLDSGTPRVADARDVAQIVEENVIARISAIQRQPIALAQRLAIQTPILARSARFFRLSRKIEEHSKTTLSDHLRGDVLESGGEGVASPTSGALEAYPNGRSRGGVGFVQNLPYRLSQAYLRLSLPLFGREDLDDESESVSEPRGPFLVVVPAGGVFCFARDETCKLFLDYSLNTCTVLSPRAEEDRALLPRVALWMKSAPALAYLLMDARETGALLQSGRSAGAHMEYGSLPLPQALLADAGKDLDDIATTIGDLEHKFLEAPMPESPAEYQECIEQHNLSVDRYAYEAEAVIADILGLDEDDAVALDDFLKSRRLYALDGVDAETGRGIQAMPAN